MNAFVAVRRTLIPDVPCNLFFIKLFNVIELLLSATSLEIKHHMAFVALLSPTEAEWML